MKQNDLQINLAQQPISLKEMALRTIKNAVLEGRLKPEALYSDKNIAKTLGISKTPVREALIELSSRELFVHEPRKGFKIKSLSVEDVKNLFDYRMTLEMSIINRVIPTITADGIRKLEKILCDNKKQLERKKNYNRSIIADRLFHLQLAELSENPFFLRAVKQVRDLCDLAGTWSLINKERKYESQLEHEELLEAIKAKSLEDSIEKMKHHLQSTCNKIIEKL